MCIAFCSPLYGAFLSPCNLLHTPFSYHIAIPKHATPFLYRRLHFLLSSFQSTKLITSFILYSQKESLFCVIVFCIIILNVQIFCICGSLLWLLSIASKNCSYVNFFLASFQINGQTRSTKIQCKLPKTTRRSPQQPSK
jgi:hypothetical protein